MGAILAGYFGTDSQKTLQARAEAHAAAEDAALVYRGQPGKPVIEPAE